MYTDYMKQKRNDNNIYGMPLSGQLVTSLIVILFSVAFAYLVAHITDVVASTELPQGGSWTIIYFVASVLIAFFSVLIVKLGNLKNSIPMLIAMTILSLIVSVPLSYMFGLSSLF